MRLVPRRWVWVSDAEDKALWRAMFKQAHIAGASGIIASHAPGYAPISGPTGYVPGPMTWTLGSVTVNGKRVMHGGGSYGRRLAVDSASRTRTADPSKRRGAARVMWREAWRKGVGARKLRLTMRPNYDGPRRVLPAPPALPSGRTIPTQKSTYDSGQKV
jgi:hypothetical protein